MSKYGLWSLSRMAFHPDPEKLDGTPLRFANIMDAILCAGEYSKHFRLVPVRIKADGTPNADDLNELTQPQRSEP